jgi:hypothetical protein
LSNNHRIAPFSQEGPSQSGLCTILRGVLDSVNLGHPFDGLDASVLLRLDSCLVLDCKIKT